MAGDSPQKDGEQLGSRAKQIKDGFSSVGFIDIGDKSVALVDCGDDKEGKAVIAELKRRNLDETAVKALFITHGQSGSHRRVREVSEGRDVRDGGGERSRRRKSRREGADAEDVRREGMSARA
jgi:glyoxylase-like metal-dependent hydrolase (beta-lactamase superfamily II)